MANLSARQVDAVSRASVVVAAALIGVLAGCADPANKPSSKPAGTTQPASQPAAPANPDAPGATGGGMTMDPAPKGGFGIWPTFARTDDGGVVAYDGASLGTMGTGERFAWVEVRNNSDQEWTRSDGSLFLYRLERRFYMYRCASEEYAIAETRILDQKKAVFDAKQTFPAKAEDWRKANVGIARALLPIVCKDSRVKPIGG
jgi:hypothetical protein